MENHSLVFVSVERFCGVDTLVSKFKGCLEIQSQKPSIRVLSAHCGRPYEIGREISKCLSKPLVLIHSLDLGLEITFDFVKNYSLSCRNEELTFIVVNYSQLRYIQKNIKQMAGYLIGKIYIVK